MGVQSTFHFSTGATPRWDAIGAKLAETGDAAGVRMIDGLPAFPDEIPADGWNEVRIALAGTMLTLRRTGDSITVVTWGTADPALEAVRNRVGQALNALGGKAVES